MQINDFMKTYFQGFLLVPDFYRQNNYGIHIELGRDIYQLNKDDTLNMNRFDTIYRQINEIISLLFYQSDKLYVVINSYPCTTKKVFYPNFFKKYIKQQKLKYSLRFQAFYWRFDEDKLLIQQMTLKCKFSDVKVRNLLKTCIHKDFPALCPQLRQKGSLYAPDVFLINVRTKCVFHLYDDRGCEFVCSDENVYKEIVAYFKNWDIQSKFK